MKTADITAAPAAPLAVIGLGCLFPKADNVGAYYVPITKDLFNSDQPTFSSLTTTYPNDWNEGSQSRLNDGVAAAHDPIFCPL